MKASSKTIIFVLIALVVGFFVGMEYKAYQVRSSMQQSLSDLDEVLTENLAQDEVESEEEEVIVEKAINDEVELATVKFKVNSVEETNTLTAQYSQPTTANKGTKFVVVDLDLTNVTKEPFTYFDFDFFQIVDQDDNFYNPSESISVIDNYLSSRELSPNMPENGKVVFELPESSTNYSLTIGKAGTNEVYYVKLK